MIRLIDIILPPSCAVCRCEGFFICPACRKNIFSNRFFICPICKRRDICGRLDAQCRKETGLTRFLGAPLLYEDERVRKIIHAFKYQRVKSLAKPLGEMLLEFLASNGAGLFCSAQGGDLPTPLFQKMDSPLKSQKRPAPFLVPVPMIPFRERERGFNQATEIAKVLARYYGLELNAKLLKKIKNTSNQADIKDKESRIKNIEGAFECVNPGYIRGKTVILVDDVYTTGATMKDCARALRSAGAREVWGIALAR